jgi:DNA-binding NarL/FixJ family response regulator
MSIKITLLETDAHEVTKNHINGFPDLQCERVFSNIKKFVSALPNLKTDVILIDTDLNGKNGIDCIRHSLKIKNVNFVVFTKNTTSNVVFDAFTAGANGYILKDCNSISLADAIRDAHAGGSPMSRKIARMVTNSFQSKVTKQDELKKLTKKEQSVLTGLEKGWTYSEIAAHHSVSTHTVRSQVRNIYIKLEVHTRTEALIKVFNRF